MGPPRCHCELHLSTVGVDEGAHGHPREQTQIGRLFEATWANNGVFKCWRNALMLLITMGCELKSSLYSCSLSGAH